MTMKDLMPWTFRKKEVPVRRETGNPFSLLQREMNDLFDNFFGDFGIRPFDTGLNDFGPIVDVSGSDKEIRVTAELPGMEEKDIDVSINHESLTMKGEKKEEKEDKGRSYYVTERSYGSFSRTIPLPVGVDADKAEASFKKGVLTVKLPKTAKAAEEAKKIRVRIE
jgi:HSP20 family protein